MSRKSSRNNNIDRSTWHTPTLYALTGDYGPFKIRTSGPIENVLIVLKHKRNIEYEIKRGHHPMYTYASEAQELLLKRSGNGGEDDEQLEFSDILVIDICTMVGGSGGGGGSTTKKATTPGTGAADDGNNENNPDGILKELIQKEIDETELVKSFGRAIFRVLERLRFKNICLAGYDEGCPIVLKLYDAFTRLDGPEFCTAMYLFHPTLPAKFVNSHLIGKQRNSIIHGSNVIVPQHYNKKYSNKQHGKVPNGNGRRGERQRGGGGQQQHQQSLFQLHLVFENESSRDKRLEMLRHVYPHGKTMIIPKKKEEQKATVEDIGTNDSNNVNGESKSATPVTDKVEKTKLLESLLVAVLSNSNSNSNSMEDVSSVPLYDPEYYSTLGKSLFLSKVTVEMSPYTKQYERHVEEITSDLVVINKTTTKNETADLATAAITDLSTIDWDACEKQIGGLVLRGNRCVLVRSLTNEFVGMRIPSVIPKENESPYDAAIRSIVQYCEVDSNEVMTLSPHITCPINIFGPNGRRIILQLYVLYATQPPPDGPLEDADMEDDETPYDWYTYPNAINKFANNHSSSIQQNCPRTVAALRTVSTILIEAANVGLLPCKWGGVFGQEGIGDINNRSNNFHSSVVPANGSGAGINRAITTTPAALASTTAQLTAKVEEWKPSRQGDVLQDVRKANEALMNRIAKLKNNNNPSSSGETKDGGNDFKLPVTLLSGFLGSGKTTLLSHILANYDGLKVAILVNDMGEINIDAALVKQTVSIRQKEEHMVELSNGCICCTLREDLLVEVAKIASEGTFDYLLIESTGVSEPMPVAETFTFKDSTGLRLGDIAQIDTLVTVVDGSRFLSELDSLQSLRQRNWHADPQDQRTISHLLCDQVEFANVIVLNKCDLMKDEEKSIVKRLIQSMNPTAKLIESVFSAVPLDAVLGTGLFSMSEAEKHEGWLQEARIGEHTPETEEYDVSSFTFRALKPFHPIRLHAALEGMLAKTPPYDESIILRAKGFIWLANFPQLQGDFSLAGNHYTLLPGNPWWAEIDKQDWPENLERDIAPLWHEPYGDRQQEIVIIGQNLNKQEVTAALKSCLLSEDEMSLGQESWYKLCSEAGDPFQEAWDAAIEAATTQDAHNHNHDHDHGHSHDHGH